MGSQPQNTEFRINPENLHPCVLSFVLRPIQQLWSCRDGLFTLPHFFLGKFD